MNQSRQGHHPRQYGAAADLAELDRRLNGWQPDRVGTLLFLERDGRVLLIRKRRGHGAGKINGPGGKPEPGESPRDCVLRETEEEVGIVPVGVHLAAVLKFLDLEDEDWLGYVYIADDFRGEPRSTPEAVPLWYPVHALPIDEMWDDDRYWLPRLLARERLEGEFLFRRGRLLAHRLRALAADEAFDEPAA
jgi:8-oxo-dGTP diphosphatase